MLCKCTGFSAILQTFLPRNPLLHPQQPAHPASPTEQIAQQPPQTDHGKIGPDVGHTMHLGIERRFAHPHSFGIQQHSQQGQGKNQQEIIAQSRNNVQMQQAVDGTLRPASGALPPREHQKRTFGKPRTARRIECEINRNCRNEQHPNALFHSFQTDLAFKAS